MKKVSCSCRAGCSGGMFSASKLNQSDSICGPSATAKPMSAKIAVSSSITCDTGWMVPRGRGRPGSVTSSHSARSRSSSAASASAARLARRAASSSSFRPLSAGPAVWRSSGDISPSSRIFRLTSPFLPSAARRRSSSAASSAAAAMPDRYFAFRSVRASMSGLRGNAGPCYKAGGANARERRRAPPAGILVASKNADHQRANSRSSAASSADQSSICNRTGRVSTLARKPRGRRTASFSVVTSCAPEARASPSSRRISASDSG